MEKKHRAKSERMRRRIMRRRLSLIFGAILVAGTMLLEIFLGLLVVTPAWFGSPAYYGLVFVFLAVGFVLLFVWNETGQKTEIDELEERMGQLFRKQTQSINRLANEIRKERKMWNAKFKE